MNWSIVYEVRSTEWTIQFKVNETEKDIWELLKQKLQTRNYQIIENK